METVEELVSSRRVVPFVGAGFSTVAGFPGWFGLLEKVFHGLFAGQDFESVKSSCGQDALRIAEYIVVKKGDNIGPIRHQLSLILRTPDLFVSSAHIDLVNLRAPLIYTTNFDELVESTFKNLGVACDVCSTARDVATARGNGSQIIKFHGDLQYDDTLVLTESSFLRRLDLESPLDLKFRGDILGRSLLFIGYGFGDINVRAIWSKLSRLMREVPAADRPPSYIVRLTSDPVLETLDAAVGLTTLTLDPEGRAATPQARRALLEDFMLNLTLAIPEPETTTAGEQPTYCSPALLRAAERIVEKRENLSDRDLRVLDAVSTRQLHHGVKSDADRLIRKFKQEPVTGVLDDMYRAISINYAMTLSEQPTEEPSTDDQT